MRMRLEHLCLVPNMGNWRRGMLVLSCLSVCVQAIGCLRWGRVPPPPRERVMQYPGVGEEYQLSVDVRGERYLHR